MVLLWAGAEAQGGRERTPLPHVRCLFRPDAFSRVANPGFEAAATGWSVAAGINAAGTSIARVTTDAHGGSACGSLVTAATAGSGCNYDLGSDRYWQESAYGTSYAVIAWLKRVSGPTRARLVLGSEGTPADRATLVIEDLADHWTPYRVVWMPTAHRTDAQLAICTDVAASLTVLVDDAAVYQLDAMSQVENSNMTVDATGWSVGAGINAAGDSLSRVVGSGPAGTTYASLVTTATDGSGCGYDLGSRPFVAGRTYRLRVALRHASGADVRLRLGSEGTAADRGDATVAATTAWSWRHVDWTPSADRADVALAVTNASAAALAVDLAAVEVYEAIDELSGDAGRLDVASLSWARDSRAVGTMAMTLHDPADARRYTPWDASGALHGLLRTGLRAWARATLDGRIYPVWFGTVSRWVPDRATGTCVAMCEDPMADIAAARVSVGFADDRSYRGARAALFGAGALAAGRVPVAGDARLSLSEAAIEQGAFFDGTVGDVSALDYLVALNDATGTVHHAAPHAMPEALWRYSTVSRTEAGTAASSGLSERDLADVRDMDLSDETVETTQSVGWQAYERLVPAGTTLAQARDPGSYADVDGDDPWLHFVVADVGVDDDVPEPSYEREMVWRRRRVRGSRRRVRVRTERFRRAYPDAFVPFSVTATTERGWDMSFGMPVVVDGVATAHPTATPASVSWEQADPRSATFRATAAGASTTGSVRVTGAAWRPLGQEALDLVDHAGALAHGLRPGPYSSTPYVPALGAAEGLARWRLWRWGEARLRPTLRIEHATSYPTALGLAPGGRVAVTASRYGLSSAAFAVLAVAGSCDRGGLSWSWDLSLEALPDALGTPFVLDSSALDGTDVVCH